MNELDQKSNFHFPGLVVRKDLVKAVKGNAIVPSYVLEYLLGQYCATSDEPTIQTGIETVKEILRKHYVHRNEAGLVRSNIKEKGRYKVIDKISVSLNDKTDAYEAQFSNLGIKKVLVDSGTVKAHPKLLVSGVWCIADIEYLFTEDKNASPWILSTLKPIQLSHFDFDIYIEARKQFSTDEWIDLLIQSIGFNPEMFGKRSKLTQLIRLIPFCERNYNLIELGPKGTGKSHIYSEFSPHGILISGGEVSVPKLFVNNSTGKIGLVGYWDCVAFDEFAGKQKRVDKALVDIMKNYMANKSFSRGVETLGAEASMVFVGNTQHTVPYMLKHSDLFCELPDKFYDSAFLDRIHFYIPGWEVDIIRGEIFSSDYGFVVDYLAEILRSLRNHDYSDHYTEYFSLSPDISTRDRDGIHKTFSGLMKILFPHGEATKEEIEELLKFAIEGRKRVKDQLMRIDSTYGNVSFYYTDTNGNTKSVSTLEEEEYPSYYNKTIDETVAEESLDTEQSPVPSQPSLPALKAPQEQHLIIKENQKGVSFDSLLGSYIKGASVITVTDPYIRLFYQIKNFMEFLETLVKLKAQDEEVSVHLVTTEDDFKGQQQQEHFEKIQESASSVGVIFTWEFADAGSIHARHIVTNHGWKISLDRGLDIFQHYEINDAFTFANRLQQYRPCKAFEVTFIKHKSEGADNE
ncbi:TPA: BREX system Lon protease-like protein BrxL [Legionella pneumophila]|uniref:BREX system Lon protease-like protein BrxL n=1 Tax=Legionella pneumophila TaxID=446 RepID=UPI000770AF11|nr:BREX system Lon protease-like protein BrxL [Legionella pneumophila]HAT8823097.1 BREX system Lon protease-like protein BrxL [Legionella pneumophila subsp. pneumophila]MBN5928699.1 BREX system Lon protease-like protein BrxL [Legionella pneumophila]MDO5158039.1 BREX system Lon protease-like protein BrxL [Legionella pneumophila]MDO5161964.1 BREX system Lon protease-like protein BrxL [Legionella pneumophila]MDO5164270.1 BREX system Lon protease-like protein BrxL [Legionella pneumophila]